VNEGAVDVVRPGEHAGEDGVHPCLQLRVVFSLLERFVENRLRTLPVTLVVPNTCEPHERLAPSAAG
jgi:hypothetical protein